MQVETSGKIGVNYANKQIKKLEEIMGQAAQKLDPALIPVSWIY